MRITFLLTQSLESPSGLGRYWPIAKELQQLGHQVTILALHHNIREVTYRHFVREGVQVWYVAQMHVRKVGSEKLYYRMIPLMVVVLRATLGLIWAALRVPTDVYHVGKPHPMNSVAGLLAGRLKRKPMFLDCDDYEAGSNYFRRPWLQHVIAYFEDHVPLWCLAVTANTRFTVKRLQTLGYEPERIIFVPNGVDRDRFAGMDSEKVELLRNELDLGESQLVLYLGSMSLSSHPVDLLIDAFALSVEHDGHTVLLLVGGGEDFELLKLRVSALGLEKTILFVGRVSPDEVEAYYHLADVTVDPVLDDLACRARAPLKIVESWACNTPVVTGAVGDRVWMVDGGGVVVQPDDPKALWEAITDLLSRPIELQAIRERIPALLSRYYWDVLISLWVHVYEIPSSR